MSNRTKHMRRDSADDSGAQAASEQKATGRSRRPLAGEAAGACEGMRNYREALAALHQANEPYGLTFLGIPSLPQIAKDYGTEIADALVEVICHRLKRCVRDSDDAMQVNEGEYLVIIRGAYDMDVYQSLHDRIQNVVENDIALDDTTLNVVVEFGYARFPEDGTTADEVVSAARAAMGRADRSRKRLSKREQELEEARAIPYFDDEQPQVDRLTGLPGATYFRQKAAETLEGEGNVAEGLSVVFCDIEKFKEYNLKYGYSSGDDLLKFIADTLEDVFPGDLIARLNSDRFGILTTSEGVAEKIEQVHNLVWGFRINSSIELKAGVCDIVGDGISATEAQDYARLACDSIKGRYDRIWRRYDEKLASEVARRQHVIDNLDTAIASGWIEVYYQPIVRVLSGEVCGLEALVRWNDPEFGMLPPGEFIDVLEDSHLIHKLDIHMVKRVCEDGRRTMDAGHAMVPVSINLSRLDYQLCDIFGVVDDIVEKSSFPRDYLHIEFTESAFTRDSDFFMSVIERFRNAGYQVWMDDFGSGYSSLNLLKDYMFDVLKIDMEFLRGLESNPKTRDIIASVVDMAKKLGIQTLAEGVETEDHFRFLKSIGCEMAQGYLFCKPSPLKHLLDLTDKGELVMEKRSLGTYYDAIGKVNILSPAPFETAEEDDSIEFSSGLPIAMVEYADGKLKVLLSGESFDHAIESAGVATNVDGEIVFDKKGKHVADEFLKLEQRARTSMTDEYIDFYDFKDFYTLRMLHIGGVDDRHAYLVSFSKHDMTKEEQEPFQRKTDKLVYLPEAQVTPWQQSDELDLAHTAVLVIDVLGGTEGITPGLEDMAANSIAIVKAARAKGMPIIFNSDNHIKGLDQEIELWGDHGIRGQQNGEPLVEFEVAPTDYFIPKRRYNGFFQTDLELTLRELGITTLIAVGADINICVLHTLAGAYFYGFKTIVPSDATATFLIGTHEGGLEYVQRCFDTRIVTTTSLLDRIDNYEGTEQRWHS